MPQQRNNTACMAGVLWAEKVSSLVTGQVESSAQITSQSVSSPFMCKRSERGRLDAVWMVKTSARFLLAFNDLCTRHTQGIRSAQRSAPTHMQWHFSCLFHRPLFCSESMHATHKAIPFRQRIKLPIQRKSANHATFAITTLPGFQVAFALFIKRNNEKT